MTQEKSRQKWSADVTENSDALDLKDNTVKGTPAQIAQSLKHSAEHSRRRKSSPFRSAMSMLTFYITPCSRRPLVRSGLPMSLRARQLDW